MDVVLFPIATKKDKELPFYINSIGQFDNQHYMLRASGSDEYHYIHTFSGKGNLIIENKKFIIKKDMGFISDPHIPHEYYSIEEPWSTKWLTFNGYGVEKLMKTIYQNFLIFKLQSRETLEEFLNELYVLISSNNKSNFNKCSAILYSFLMELKDEIQAMNLDINPLGVENLIPVVNYMETNYSKDILLEDLAKLINISPQHLCRLFKTSYQMRPFEYLTHLRLNKAKEMLINKKDYSIKEISKIIGFHNSNYFCYKFNKIEKCTPLQFRNRFLK